MVVVEGGGAIVVEGEEGDDLDAAADDVVHALEHFFCIAAFVEVADEDEDGFLGLADEGLAVGEGEVDVGAAAELGAEEDVDGVGEFFAEVNDGGIEHDHFGADGGQAGENGAEDAGVNDAGGHGTALVNADDDVAQGGAFATEADAGFGDDGFVLGLVMLEVRANGAVPIDFVVARAAGAVRIC